MNASAETPATFSEALHAAIRDHGVTLAWLRSRLVDSGNPVSTATLSYWRSGARTPEGVSSLAAVEEIERILGLPRGHLGSRIGPSPRLGRVSEQVVPVVPDIEDAYAQTEAALSAPPISSTRGISCQVQAYIGADGLLARRVTRSLVQSTVDGLTHCPSTGAHRIRSARSRGSPSTPEDGWGARTCTPVGSCSATSWSSTSRSVPAERSSCGRVSTPMPYRPGARSTSRLPASKSTTHGRRGCRRARCTQPVTASAPARSPSPGDTTADGCIWPGRSDAVS